MDQAAEFLGTSRPTLYRWLRDGKLKALKVGRQWRFEQSELDRFLRGEAPRIDLPANLTPFIDALRSRSRTALADSREPLEAQYLAILELALQEEATAIHLGPSFTPQDTGVAHWLRFRINGELEPIATLDGRLMAPVIAHWKKMAACHPGETALPQDGRILATVGKDNEEENVELLLSFLPTALGEAMTVKIVDEKRHRRRLQEMGFHQNELAQIQQAVHRRARLLVVSGPTSSDRESVVAGILREAAGPQINLMTLGCPAWHALPWANSLSFRHFGQSKSYEVGISTMIRSEPDVIGLGDLPNNAALKAAVEAAQRGALVVAALQGNGALGTLRRMVEMSDYPLLLSQALELIVSLRPLRILCSGCSRPVDPPHRQAESLQRIAEENTANFSQAVGCPKCGGRGYAGQRTLAEVMAVTGRLVRSVMEGAEEQALLKEAYSNGMYSLERQTARLCCRGEVSLEDARRYLDLY